MTTWRKRLRRAPCKAERMVTKVDKIKKLEGNYTQVDPADNVVPYGLHYAITDFTNTEAKVPVVPENKVRQAKKFVDENKK